MDDESVESDEGEGDLLRLACRPRNLGCHWSCSGRPSTRKEAREENDEEGKRGKDERHKMSQPEISASDLPRPDERSGRARRRRGRKKKRRHPGEFVRVDDPLRGEGSPGGSARGKTQVGKGAFFGSGRVDVRDLDVMTNAAEAGTRQERKGGEIRTGTAESGHLEGERKKTHFHGTVDDRLALLVSLGLVVRRDPLRRRRRAGGARRTGGALCRRMMSVSVRLALSEGRRGRRDRLGKGPCLGGGGVAHYGQG
jgi:hypothetical protein